MGSITPSAHGVQSIVILQWVSLQYVWEELTGKGLKIFFKIFKIFKMCFKIFRKILKKIFFKIFQKILRQHISIKLQPDTVSSGLMMTDDGE